MSTLTTVLIAILVFGILIFIHEFGHYFFARLFKVTITEFSIGMGPKLVWYDSKKTGTRYAVSMIPIGGYVAMVGEAEESDDPNSFDKKPAWQRFIITAAGAAVNILAGFIAMIILTSIVKIGGTTVAQFADPLKSELNASTTEYFEIGDEIVRIDGKRVRIAEELSYEIMRKGNRPIDVTVIRDGKEIVIPDVVFPTQEASGQTFGVMDFAVYESEKSFGRVISYSLTKSVLIVRTCWESLFDLLTGRYTIAAVSGPVGISEAIGSAARTSPSSLLYIVALISINLGVMNLLPIPALDGGRIFTLLIEMVTRKKLPAKVESMINMIGLAALLGLSFIVLIKDIFQLI